MNHYAELVATQENMNDVRTDYGLCRVLHPGEQTIFVMLHLWSQRSRREIEQMLLQTSLDPQQAEVIVQHVIAKQESSYRRIQLPDGKEADVGLSYHFAPSKAEEAEPSKKEESGLRNGFGC